MSPLVMRWLALAVIASQLLAACQAPAITPPVDPPTATALPTETPVPLPTPTPTPSPDIVLGQAADAQRVGDWDPARLLYQGFVTLAADPAARAEALLGLGQTYLQAGLDEHAVGILTQLLTDHPQAPQSAEAAFLRGLAHGQLTTGGWNSVDIDLSNYTVPNLAAIIQIKLEPNGPGTLYVDNIYFWGTGSGSADCTGGTFTGGIFAADYRGSLNPADSKPPLTTLCGDIGFFYDPRFVVGTTALYDLGGISNQVVNPGGINNFYYGFGLQLPAITEGYFGAYVNAPANGIANVASFTNLKFTLWGPAELFEKSFTSRVQVVIAGPAVAGCGSNSGRSEVQAPLVTALKIGAASNYVVPLSSFSLKFACSGETTVAEVLAKVAQVNFS